ncbi:MAG: DUF6678 family protein [Planctomycetota bacterium]
MQTDEQLRDRDRLKSYIQREQLASVMNDTKWRRLIELLAAYKGGCQFRRRSVRDSDTRESAWDPDFFHVFGGLEDIEWVEIDARVEIHRGQLINPRVEDRNLELRDALIEARIPFSIEEGVTRVWGYTRPGRSPDWQMKKA